MPPAFEFARDPKDEPYLDLAIAVRAQFLVSPDRDLLDLMDEDREESRAFRSLFPSLSIVDPLTLLREFD